MFSRAARRWCLTALAVLALLPLAPAVHAETDATGSTCVTLDSRTGRYVYGGDLSGWMSCLYEPGSATARDKRLSSIMMPGSHAAGTDPFYVAEASTFHYASECPSAIAGAANGISWITRQWAMTQTRSSAQQAALGSRWFDLRGVMDNYVWRSCDGLVGGRWFDVVDDLVAFEKAHPAEVIVVDMAQLLSPITDVSATRLFEALAPACRMAVGPAGAPLSGGNPGFVTVEEARRAGGLVIMASDSPAGSGAYARLEEWLARHPADACAGRLWSRDGTITHQDRDRKANLWRHRNTTATAASHMVAWHPAALRDARGSFQVSQFTWDFSGPQAAMRYQIWLMNNWLIDYNQRLAHPTREVANALWKVSCRTGIPANVILLDNISRQRPLRELVAYNAAPCP